MSQSSTPPEQDDGFLWTILGGLVTALWWVVSNLLRLARRYWPITGLLLLVGAGLHFGRLGLALGLVVSGVVAFVLYRRGWWGDFFADLRLRDHHSSLSEAVASRHLPVHRVVTEGRRVVGFDLTARPGEHAEALAKGVPALLASWAGHIPPDAVPECSVVDHRTLRVVLRPPLTIPSAVTWTADQVPRSGTGFLVVALTSRGPISWETSRVPHAVVVGATGSGKSVTVQALLAQALLCGVGILALDPKQLDLGWIAPDGLTLPTRHAWNLDDMAVLAELAAAEMTARLALCRDAGVDHVRDLGRTDLRPLVVVVEEAAELLDTSGKPATDAEKKEQALRGRIRSAVTSIARLGRAADIHLLLAAQRPDATILSGQLRAQLRARIVLRDIDPSGAEMVELPSDVRDQLISLGRPGAAAVFSDGTWALGQAPYLSRLELTKLVTTVAAQHPAPLELLVSNPATLQEGESDDDPPTA